VTESPVLPIARITLRVVIVLNWAFGAAILALLVATIVAEHWTFAALGIRPGSWISSMIIGLRAIAALGLVAIPLNDIILARVFAAGAVMREDLAGTV
jgi:hypothetical protein